MGRLIADQTGSGGSGGNAGAGAIAISGGGAVILEAVNSFTGGVSVSGATLDLAATGAAGSGTISLGDAARLEVQSGVTIGNAVSVAIGDVIDTAGITDATATFNAGTLTIAGTGGSLALTLTNAAATTADFTAVNDGHGGAEITFVACYCPGTRIATPDGNIAIEALRIGDLVTTHAGEAKPIKWIGRRAYAPAFVAANPQLRPVRIRAHAIAPGVPARDLLVSPQHAVLVGTDFGAALVPAGALVNGRSILRDTPTDGVAYLHLELERHQLIEAEGLAAETFIDCVGRGIFQNAAEFAALYPDDAEAAPSQQPPRLEQGFALADAHRRIAARAGLATAAPRPGALRGHVERIVDHPDGVLIEGWVLDESNQQTAQEMEVLCPGAAPVRLLANRYRADLDRAGLAGGRCGFSQIIPAASGAILVRRAADGAMLHGATDLARAA